MPNSVVVNGLSRTGSTRVFLAAQAVLKFADVPYATLGSAFSQVDEQLDLLSKGVHGDKWLLIKSHRWMPLKQWDGCVVLYSRRNLADVASSLYRRGLRQHWTAFHREMSPAEHDALETWLITYLRFHEFVENYMVPKYNFPIIDYEEYYDRDEALIEHVAEFMKLSLTKPRLQDAAHFISIKTVKEIADKLGPVGDEITRIQQFHISETLGRAGGGMEVLPKRVADDLKLFWPLKRY